MNPVFPSILSTNFFDLHAKLKTLAAQGIDFIHLDIMDGHFVDTISFGPAMARALKSSFPFRLDAHLMVSHPAKMVPRFIEAGVEWISFHLETDADPEGLIGLIHKSGCRAGLVLNPDTPVERLYPYLQTIDYVLLMSVFPGKGGQAFIAATLERVRQLKGELRRRQSPCLLQVDGGITSENIAPLKEAGADLFVIGTHLFNAENMEEKIGHLLKRLQWSQP